MGLKKLVFALCGIVLFAGLSGTVGPSTSVAQSQDAEQTERTAGSTVGASVAHPEKWFVEREENTYDGTFGFVLWDPKREALEDHGGEPAARVALAPEIKPGQIDATVQEKLAAYPDLQLKRQQVSVGEKDFQGVAVGTIPGSTPSTEVYVPVEDRVYRINVYGESLNEQGRELLSSLRFYEPARPVESLDLEEASPEPQTSQQEERWEEATEDPVPQEETFSGMGGRNQVGERKISEGCWRASRRFFVQTQHDSNANSRSGDGIRKGWTVAGRPNYWGQYTHGNIGQGRCTGRYNTNDKFAVDYPFNRGDLVFSPFKKGTVVFSGANRTHANYGKFVVIKANNGKYVSLSAHLNGIPSSIRKGKVVYKNTVIGYAGDTGGATIPVGEVHLHQAFYRYPKYNPDGSPYGGAGLRVDRPRYSGTAARKLGYNTRIGRYQLGWAKPNYSRYCKERITCGEGYKIGN